MSQEKKHDEFRRNYRGWKSRILKKSRRHFPGENDRRMLVISALPSFELRACHPAPIQ
jgi:hypothetical protein